MLKIKFSHFYKKLNMKGQPVKTAKLLIVLPVNLEELPDVFLDYDTDKGKYQLPKKGSYLILVFQKDECNLFTTIRRWTETKLDYYRSNIGQDFQVVIEGEDNGPL